MLQKFWVKSELIESNWRARKRKWTIWSNDRRIRTNSSWESWTSFERCEKEIPSDLWWRHSACCSATFDRLDLRNSTSNQSTTDRSIDSTSTSETSRQDQVWRTISLLFTWLTSEFEIVSNNSRRVSFLILKRICLRKHLDLSEQQRKCFSFSKKNFGQSSFRFCPTQTNRQTKIIVSVFPWLEMLICFVCVWSVKIRRLNCTRINFKRFSSNWVIKWNWRNSTSFGTSLFHFFVFAEQRFSLDSIPMDFIKSMARNSFDVWRPRVKRKDPFNEVKHKINKKRFFMFNHLNRNQVHRSQHLGWQVNRFSRASLRYLLLTRKNASFC